MRVYAKFIVALRDRFLNDSYKIEGVNGQKLQLGPLGRASEIIRSNNFA